MPVNTAMYFERWLKTATGGKISCTFAFAADRMMLVCHTCQASYTAQTPEGTTVDFGVQQFVELHLHKGGYTKPTGDMKPVPLTADFKGVDYKPEMAKRIFDTTPMPNSGGEILKIATGRKFR